MTTSGMGRFIEHVSCHGPSNLLRANRPVFQYHRTVAFDALLGGAEDVLTDLGVRQALRDMPKDARL